MRRSESTGNAVELMTTWLANPDGPPEVFVASLEAQLGRHPSGDAFAAALELIMGMSYLAGSLLVLRELEFGESAQATLQALALRNAEDEGPRSLGLDPQDS